MPEPSTPVVAPLATPVHTRGAGAALRIALGAIFAVSLLAIPQAVAPEPAAAGASCTGWTSTTTPPRTIRVLRTGSGAVETVDFRKYVAKVMASGEWPSRLRRATLEAGALATKQYAWYYTMAGNHRSHYVRNGRCYDVRDDTTDQLYKAYAAPTSRQQAAVNATWELTLRKFGRFFLTGYRAGVTSTCAADANGWKLFARSVESCASRGWSSGRILRTYLSPNLSFIWADRIGPEVSRPKVVLKVGNSLATGAATVSWNPLPRTDDISAFRLQRKVAGGDWRDVSLQRPKVWQTDAWVKLDARNRFRVKARNEKGVWGDWSYSARSHADVRGPTSMTLAGTVETASLEPQRVRARFTGRSVALMARTGPGMGKVKVFVDGKRVAIVDLDRANVSERKLVWAKNWSRVAEHGISVKPVTTTDRVDFNGFFLLR